MLEQGILVWDPSESGKARHRQCRGEWEAGRAGTPICLSKALFVSAYLDLAFLKSKICDKPVVWRIGCLDKVFGNLDHFDSICLAILIILSRFSKLSGKISKVP